MKATFANRLECQDDPKHPGIKRVVYKHSFRCQVFSWFERSEQNPMGWMIQFESDSQGVLKEFKGAIFKQAVHYIEMRTRHKITNVTFDELVDLAETQSVQSIEK